MDDPSACRNSLQKEDKSLAFDQVAYDSFRAGSSESGRIINDRLSIERMKALEALQKSQKRSFVFKNPHPVIKESSKTEINVSSNIPSTKHDHTDYVPFRRPNAINISDLVTDETINLESSTPYSSLASTDIKVSFEPNEITGRSTLYKKDIKRNDSIGEMCNEVSKTKNISVSDILASSFAQKARNLCETLQSCDIPLHTNENFEDGIRPSSELKSSISSLNEGRSLPRTADMSLSKNSCTEESFNYGLGTISFNSATADNGLNESENFAPGELMQSKLINDEISWAEEYAAIPAVALSKQAKAKVLRNSENISNAFDFPSISNSIIAGDPNFSVGNFFNMRSDNIWDIVKSKSPVKFHTPVALVDSEDNTVTTTTDLEGASKITPKVDNKTYTRVDASATPLENKKLLPKINVVHVSKDSGNSKDSSFLLSISAIDRALHNLDIQSDFSGIGVSEQALMKEKNSKTFHEPDDNENNLAIGCSKRRSFRPDNKVTRNEKITVTEEMILENKENLDPKSNHISGAAALCDTMSFTESLLNSTDMKNLQRSINLSRSPLSSLDVSVPNIQVSLVHDGGHEADNDEWPDTPIASKRRVRRTKSPHNKSPRLSYTSGEIATENCVKNKSEKEPKSLSSTRLDGGDSNPHADCNFILSPNISQNSHSPSSLVVRSNTLCIPRVESPKLVSPSRSDKTEMSSPHSYHLSQVTSPTPSASVFRSPNLDTTSSSDRQLLCGGPARKVVASPVGSEASSACSYATMRTYRSAISGGNGRSVSRCSSSSEFSHRDGKQIPLKVTNMELSWGSTKLRSNSRKSMQIKNIVNKRLVIRIEISGPGYQIVNSQRSNTITLHSQECRTISICFCPTVCGVAIGKLSFFAPSGAQTVSNSFLDVPLYGYGGNASIITQNISNGPVGSPFITMGNLCDLAQPLERIVSFYNKGPLLGFASVSIDSIGLMLPRLSDAFEIHPRRILIPPKNIVDVRIVFRPKREEIKKIIKKLGNVLTLANMRVICGDEANRQRIRRLLSQMTEEERNKLSSSSLDMVWTKFPQELEMRDLHDIKETPSVSMDLTSFFRIHEILLTINHDNLDDTFESSSLLFADVDETVLFRTICAVADSPTPPCNLATVEEHYEDDGENDGRATTNSPKPGSWCVSPKSLHINLNKPVSVSLHMHNGFKSRQYFEIVCNIKDILDFTPSDGYVAPNGHTEIIIGLHANFQYPSENVYIMVYMENEQIMVPVNFTN